MEIAQIRSQINSLRSTGEQTSERGDQVSAFDNFNQAFILAMQIKDYATAINLLGHRLHIYKSHFAVTNDPSFMELFYMETQIGLRLAKFHHISGQPVSVMHLRAGDYFLFTGDNNTAVEQYELACAELGHNGISPATQAEYIGHLAQGLASAGRFPEAFTKFAEASKLLAQPSPDMPVYNQLIIESGIYLRWAMGLAESGDIESAREQLQHAWAPAKRVRDEFAMSTRSEQVQAVASHLGLQLQ